MKKIFWLIIIATISFSCAKKKEEKHNVEIDYLHALKLLKNKDYTQAAEAFEKIDGEYPFSKWAAKSQTMAVYARYKSEEYDKLLQVADDFIRLNPANEYVPYVMYMKGLSYYNQIPGIKRAQDNTQQASFVFRELIARFPTTDYALDAKEKLPRIDENLAGAKMSIGRYQIQQNNYIGAINNFYEVADRYRNTKQAPEAYFRISEIYYKIGLKEQGSKVYSIMKEIYPDNEWTKLGEKFEGL